MAGIAVATWRLSTTQAPQQITIGASSAKSNAVGSQTYAVWLCATVACFISIDQSPTAASSGAGANYLPANVPVVLGIGPGAEVAVIESAAGAGTLYMSELTH